MSFFYPLVIEAFATTFTWSIKYQCLECAGNNTSHQGILETSMSLITFKILCASAHQTLPHHLHWPCTINFAILNFAKSLAFFYHPSAFDWQISRKKDYLPLKLLMLQHGVTEEQTIDKGPWKYTASSCSLWESCTPQNVPWPSALPEVMGCMSAQRAGHLHPDLIDSQHNVEIQTPAAPDAKPIIIYVYIIQDLW